MYQEVILQKLMRRQNVIKAQSTLLRLCSAFVKRLTNGIFFYIMIKIVLEKVQKGSESTLNSEPLMCSDMDDFVEIRGREWIS